ncbi:DUF1345 domain-containing protein [Actinoplanes regularis]|uniref:Uncharacterized membrane protein n=1 Tax=Actinoplanes regularis TaxID=52697 RepID=A0A238YBP5_9ACTN|nr:DUF1345 domain-containing protein [Actinoplanes regularis]GIE86052.1 hypothetical protein Are01nite_25320 [Actinoplanes regularis]SNR68033.1 Uncharacterized membrane protein [Actinoplanes regularis]
MNKQLPVPAQPSSSPADVPAGASHQQLVEVIERVLHDRLSEHLDEVEQRMAGTVRTAVDSGRRGLDRAVEVCTPAWLRPTAGEPRWPAAIAVVAAIGLQLSVPGRLAIRPQWLLPVLEAAILALLIVANPGRISTRHPWVRRLGLILVGVATLANAYSAGHLILNLVHGREGESAAALLTIGGAVWLTNIIVFALWYWEFDRGGPAARAHATYPNPDFQFAQMAAADGTYRDGEPSFVDYLYLSFTNAAAFSPTDTLPMTPWAKLLMLTQSCVSLATVALVIARAVNIL